MAFVGAGMSVVRCAPCLGSKASPDGEVGSLCEEKHLTKLGTPLPWSSTPPLLCVNLKKKRIWYWTDPVRLVQAYWIAAAGIKIPET